MIRTGFEVVRKRDGITVASFSKSKIKAWIWLTRITKQPIRAFRHIFLGRSWWEIG